MYSLIIVLAFFVAASTIVSGVILMKGDHKRKSALAKTVTYVSVVSFAALVATFLFVVFPGAVSAADASGASESFKGLAYLAAGLSTGLAAIGAGYAVAVVGSAALGALSEDGKVFGKTLIYVGLAEGIAIYGLIISIMILSNLA